MDLINFSSSYWSLLPTILTLILAILTRRVILALSVGILTGTFMLTDFSIKYSIDYLFHNIFSIIYNINTQKLNWDNTYIILFLLLLGILTSLLSLSGSNQAFAIWIQKYIKTPRQAQLMAASLVFITFIDGYFHSLAVGAIARPVTDKFHISRAKLAYILDSTAAPMCALVPISSWGAYVMTLISGLLGIYMVSDYSVFNTVIMMGAMNYYAIFSILLVFLVSYFSFDIGPMKKYNNLTQITNIQNNFISHNKTYVKNLVLPMFTLIFTTIFCMIIIGIQTLNTLKNPISILAIFEHTNVSISLLIGALCSISVASICIVVTHQLSFINYIKAWFIGIKSMLAALLILGLAWTINKVINDMQTGTYLAHLISNKLPIATLPALLFLLSSVMAIATGTSWGTFGIMLPIAAAMTHSIDPDLMIVSLSAVMAGAVCGDHCSPISDTTILSSTGAQCDHIEHVITQIPYAILVAIATTVGYLTVGYTYSAMLGFITATATLLCLMLFLHIKRL